LSFAQRKQLDVMEATETIVTREEENARIVARYRAFLKRREEEWANHDADPERQKRIAETSAKLMKQNEEEGTPITTAICVQT